MEIQDFKIRLFGTTSGQVNHWAGELKDALSDECPSVRISQIRERSDAMAWGSILQSVPSWVVWVQIQKTLEAGLLKRRGADVEQSNGQPVEIKWRFRADSADWSRSVLLAGKRFRRY